MQVIQIIKTNIQPINTQKRYIQYCGWQEFLKMDTDGIFFINELDCSQCIYTRAINETVNKILKFDNIFINTLNLKSLCATEFHNTRLKYISYIRQANINIQPYNNQNKRINCVLCSYKSLNKTKDTIDKFDIHSTKHIDWEYIYINNIHNIKNINEITHVNLAFCGIREIITQVIEKLQYFPKLTSIDFYGSNFDDNHIGLMEKYGIYNRITHMDTTKCQLLSEPIYKTIVINTHETSIHNIDGGTINLTINNHPVKHNVFSNNHKYSVKHKIFNQIHTIQDLRILGEDNDNLRKFVDELLKTPHIINIYVEQNLLEFANKIKRPNSTIYIL